MTTPQAPHAPAGAAPVSVGERRSTGPACAFCGQPTGKPSLALFCSAAHQAAFHNRNSKLGRSGVVQLALAWRAGRNHKGSSPEAVRARLVASRAFGELCRLLDDAAREDREAGRDAIRYLLRRWRAEGTFTA